MSRAGNVTTLQLPDGGSLDIPLPGAGDSRFVMRAGSSFADATGSFRLVPVLTGVVIGVVIGVAATAWYMHRRAR